MLTAIVVVVSMISVSLGLLVGLSAAMVLVTGALLVRSELRLRRERLDLREMLAAIRGLAREVRSGAQPLAAIAAGERNHRGRAAQVLGNLAVSIAADRGGRSPSNIATAGSVGNLAAEIGGRLATGWALSARYGVPWAGLIDALTVDLAERLRGDCQRTAQVAGPRVSGYVMAVLPALGLVLGVGMGADPIHVLLHTVAGQLMLLIGSCLTCSGLAWIARIVRA